ncbi:hypothetical protein QZH41_006462 [Actinostola sp. cb2023]|nr:hypothetical protein QZH41_006462 [Actinostola sp. cb2023]
MDTESNTFERQSSADPCSSMDHKSRSSICSSIYPSLDSLSIISKPKSHSQEKSPYIGAFPNGHVREDPAHNNYVHRKRGRPRKYWPLYIQNVPEHDAKPRKNQALHGEREMPPLTFVKRRKFDTKKTAVTRNEEQWPTINGVIDGRSYAYSEMLNELSHNRSHVGRQVSIPRDDAYVSGCLECYYGNGTCCSYSTGYRESVTRASHGQSTPINQEEPYHIPCYPVKIPLERVHGIIKHEYADRDPLQYPDFSSRYITNQDSSQKEATPIIIKCFSLARDKADPKSPQISANESDRFPDNDSTKDTPKGERDCKLKYNQSYAKSKSYNSFDGNCLVCHQIATEEVTQERCIPANEHNVYCYAQDQQIRVLPVPTVSMNRSPTLEAHHAQQTETITPNGTDVQEKYKSPQVSPPIKTQEQSTPKLGISKQEGKIDIDYYEIYHSKYYKKTPKWGINCNDENTKTSLARKDKTKLTEFSRVHASLSISDIATQPQEEERVAKIIETKNNDDTKLVTRNEEKNKNREAVHSRPISSFNTREAQSLQNADLPLDSMIDYERMNTDIPSFSPESLAESVDESLDEKNWEAVYQEILQESYTGNSSTKCHVCVHCGRVFTHLSSLNNHVRTHTGQKPFRCRFCGKRFAQSGVLTAHLRTHTGDRPFECDFCKKRFAQTTTLANHIRTHTGQKPFNCKFCKRTFAQSSTRNKHELSHTKEKPYTCKYCGRRFAQSATVTRHMRIHMRQDNFVCVHCGKEFPLFARLGQTSGLTYYSIIHSA